MGTGSSGLKRRNSGGNKNPIGDVNYNQTFKQDLDDGTRYNYDLKIGNTKVGDMTLDVYDDGDTAVIDRIDIDTQYRNQGFGTRFIKDIANKYFETYIVPDNENARRLYARLGDDSNIRSPYDYLDQGYGVFKID